MRDAEFDRAFDLLRDLVDGSVADQQFPTRGNAVDTTGVVLWMRCRSGWLPNGRGSLR